MIIISIFFKQFVCATHCSPVTPECWWSPGGDFPLKQSDKNPSWCRRFVLNRPSKRSEIYFIDTVAHKAAKSDWTDLHKRRKSCSSPVCLQSESKFTCALFCTWCCHSSKMPWGKAGQLMRCFLTWMKVSFSILFMVIMLELYVSISVLLLLLRWRKTARLGQIMESTHWSCVIRVASSSFSASLQLKQLSHWAHTFDLRPF